MWGGEQMIATRPEIVCGLRSPRPPPRRGAPRRERLTQRSLRRQDAFSVSELLPST